jgi:hypothetical protein
MNILMLVALGDFVHNEGESLSPNTSWSASVAIRYLAASPAGAAVLDLNGDGKLELIVHSFFLRRRPDDHLRCGSDKIEAALSVQCGV